MSGGVLLYVDAKSAECNEAGEAFSATGYAFSMPIENIRSRSWRE
jgi:hypothetical protein